VVAVGVGYGVSSFELRAKVEAPPWVGGDGCWGRGRC